MGYENRVGYCNRTEVFHCRDAAKLLCCGLDRKTILDRKAIYVRRQ